MEMVACIILTDIQDTAPYMMITMVMVFGAAVAEARAHGLVLALGGVPVVMVAPVALAPVHAPAAEVVVLVAVVILEAVAVREVMEALAVAAPVAVVTDNLAKAAFFKV
ncbi:hypothetical protein NBRC3222_2376 [Acetobacter pasteurianus NBRC 3222]|nr:hypothetical protein NBRC3222_2376 [Acetobacter pasteurianus NBRC 3222]